MCVQGIVDGPQGSIRRRVGLGVGIMTTPTRVCARDCGCASREYQKARGFVRGHPNDACVQGVVGLKGVSGGTAGLLESVGIMGAVGPSLCTDKVNACNAARRMYAHLLLGAAHVKA